MEECIKPNILVVEDELSIRRFIAINLKRNDFSVYEAGSGEDALSILGSRHIHVIILDIMLPGINGFEVCERVRNIYPNIAIIMLTAKGQDMDKLMGLELGADDYMVKPFNPLELVARIRSILRRISIHNQLHGNSIVSGPFVLDLQGQRLLKDNSHIDLTPREFSLIRLFIENPNRAFTRDELLDHAWGEDFFGDPKTVDVHIRRLREKLEDDSSKPVYIETIWGHGYRYIEVN